MFRVSSIPAATAAAGPAAAGRRSSARPRGPCAPPGPRSTGRRSARQGSPRVGWTPSPAAVRPIPFVPRDPPSLGPNRHARTDRTRRGARQAQHVPQPSLSLNSGLLPRLDAGADPRGSPRAARRSPVGTHPASGRASPRTPGRAPASRSAAGGFRFDCRHPRHDSVRVSCPRSTSGITRAEGRGHTFDVPTLNLANCSCGGRRPRRSSCCRVRRRTGPHGWPPPGCR